MYLLSEIQVLNFLEEPMGTAYLSCSLFADVGPRQQHFEIYIWFCWYNVSSSDILLVRLSHNRKRE
jgi:hypothetical protein